MRHGQRTIQEAIAVFDLFDAAKFQISLAEGFQPVKFAETTFGQLEAFRNRLPQGVWERVIAGQLEIVVEGDKAIVVEKALPFFDHTGRRIPQGLKAKVVDPDRSFHLVQPEKIDYFERLCRLADAFQVQAADSSSARFFEDQAQGILDGLHRDERLAGLTKAVWLPIMILQIDAISDYGSTIEQSLIPAVESSYKKEFSGRTFTNHRKNDLARKVKVVDDSHARLVADLAKGQVIGVYFPNALQGFSITADREQISGLPDFVSLAGGVDTLTGLTMYPDVLARDQHTPGLDMAALQWQSQRYSLSTRADDDRLGFDGGDLGARGRYSGGLFVRR